MLSTKNIFIIISIAAILIGLFIKGQSNKDTPITNPNRINTELKSQSQVDLSNMEKIKKIASKNGLPLKQISKSNVVEYHNSTHDNFDFEPHLTIEQKKELYHVTNKSHKGLVVEVDKNGIDSVDLKKRFSHAHVSVIDENGIKRTGEYSQTSPISE